MPEKELEWNGLHSSLRLMNIVFKPIISLCKPFMEQALPTVKPLPMQECIVKALVRIAHAIDSKFDEQQDLIEKLEHRNMLIRRDFSSMVNSRLQTRQAEIEATLKIFNECIETVKNEVALRKQEQFKTINSLQRKVHTQISGEDEGQREQELKPASL